jgi:hypothetical protein
VDKYINPVVVIGSVFNTVGTNECLQIRRISDVNVGKMLPELLRNNYLLKQPYAT